MNIHKLISKFQKSTLQIVFFIFLFSQAALCDYAKLLDSDEDAVLARFHILDNAKESIDISYFIFNDDTSGMLVLAQARDAAKRGVKVRILVDNMYNRISPDVMGYLIKEGVEIREYHQNTIRHPSWYFRRMHDKLFINENSVISGGRNIQNGFFTDRKAGRNRFADLDIYMEGDVSKDARKYFEHVWSSRHVAPPKVKPISADTERKIARNLDRYQGIVETWKKENGLKSTSLISGKHDVGKIQMFHDNVETKGIATGSEEGFLKLIREAKKSLFIESPYVILTDDFVKELTAAKKRGVEIKLVTNSPEANDIRSAGYRYAAEREMIKNIGIEIQEFAPPAGQKATIHGKIMVADGNKIAIGTYNLDPRSRNLNTEEIFSFHSNEVAEEYRSRVSRIQQTTLPYDKARIKNLPFKARCSRYLLEAISKLVRSQL